jgi:tyrosyl-tRNA synthetase
LWKYLSKRKLLVKKEVTSLPESDELALQRLEELRASAPWKKGQGRAAIFQLSEIVRSYLGQRLKFSALDLTSEEFIQELHHRRLLGLDLAQLTEEVRWEDMVKFAKLEPTEEECLRGISQAESMIRHTRPQRAVAA